jgi:hypothetical protein
MAYVLFDTEQEAQIAEAQAVANARAFALIHAPERLSADGTLIGFNAASGNLDPKAQHVERWAVPQQYQEGWAWPIPTFEDIDPMPVESFMDGVSGVIVDDVTPLPTEDSGEI